VVMTSSPGAIWSAEMHKNRPLVPLLTAMACFRPMYFARAVSNSWSFGPSERWGVRRTFETALISFSVMSGRDKCIRISASDYQKNRDNSKKSHFTCFGTQMKEIFWWR